MVSVCGSRHETSSRRGTGLQGQSRSLGGLPLYPIPETLLRPAQAQPVLVPSPASLAQRQSRLSCNPGTGSMLEGRFDYINLGKVSVFSGFKGALVWMP